MSRRREIEELGGRCADDSDVAEIIEDAFETYRSRGELPPVVRELIRHAEGEASAEAEAEAEAALRSPGQAMTDLFDRLVECLHAEVVNQVNRIDKVPISIDELRLGPDLSGVALMYEPRHVCLSDFEASIDFEAEGAPLTWSVLSAGARHRFRLADRFDGPSLERLRALLRAPDPSLFAAYYVRAAETWLKLGDEFPWRDRFADPCEKHRRALVLLEKARALDPGNAELEEKVRRTRAATLPTEPGPA